MKKLFSMILALCLLLSAFAAFADDVDYKADYAAKITKLADSMRAYYEASGESDKIAPYAEPLPIHMVSRYNSGMQDAMSIFTNKYGESWDVNRYTELYKAILGFVSIILAFIPFCSIKR